MVGATGRKYGRGTYSVCQVLGREYATESLVIVDDEDAVGALGSTQLTGFRDGDVVWDGEGGTRLECRDCSLGYWWLWRAFAAAGLEGGGDGTLPGEFGLDFLADCLAGD